MKQLLSLFSLSGMLLASGCVYDGAAPRTRLSRTLPILQARSTTASGWLAPPPIQRSGLPRYSGLTPASTGGVRLSTVPPAARPSVTYTRYRDYAADPRYGQASRLPEIRRLTGPTLSGPSGAPAHRREIVIPSPPRQVEIREPERRPVVTMAPVSAADRLSSIALARTKATGHPQSPLHRPPAKSPSREAPPVSVSPGKLPFALPVAGRTGYAKLPNHPNLPDIDVRGIAPGTPVEVPNPGPSGGMIQFRVP